MGRAPGPQSKAGVGDSRPLKKVLADLGRLPDAAGSQWSMELFAHVSSTGGSPGIFTVLPGSINASDNAGSHYYHWVGMLSQVVLGEYAARFGIERERTTKAEQAVEQNAPDLKRQGSIQADNALVGRDLGACIENHLSGADKVLADAERAADDKAKQQEANAAQPCPPISSVREKCPWTPDGYTIGECTPGFCYDGGPQGFLACKPRDEPPLTFRNENRNLQCPPGYDLIRDRCTGVPLACRRQPPPPPSP